MTKDSQDFTLQATLADTVANSADKNRGSLLLDYLTWPGRIALLLAIVLSPWAFGSARPWAQQWIAVAMMVGLVFWWFESSLNQKSKQHFPYIFFPVFLGLLIGLFQLWELPQWLASIFLGRQVEIFQEFGAELKMSPSISVSRAGTQEFLSLLALGVAAMLLGSRYFKSTFEIKLLLTVVTVNGFLIALFGIVQKLTSDPMQMFWMIDIEQGAPFGPYINRNNAAGYLLICLACAFGLVTILIGKKEDRGPRPIISKEIPFWRQLVFHFQLFWTDLTATKIAAIIAAGVIFLGVIASLSRGGITALLIGSFVTLMLYGMARKPTFTGFLLLPGLFLAIGVAGWLGFSESLTQRFERVELVEVDENSRISHWQDSLGAVNDVGLLGAGIGAYEGIHRMYRTSPESKVYTFGESQFVQTALEMGWFGLTLLLASWFLVLYYGAFSLWRGSSPATIGIGVTGVFLATAVPIASAFDFGIYHAANMTAVATLAGFLAYQSQALAGRLKDKTWLRFELPNFFAQAVALTIFAMVFVAWLGISRRATIADYCSLPVNKFTYQNPNKEKTEDLINELSPLLSKTPDDDGLIYLADLYIHLMRIQSYKAIVSDQDNAENARRKQPEERATFLNNLWKLTAPEYIQENIYSIRREVSSAEANKFRKNPIFAQTLPPAINALHLSRRSNLLEPFAYVRLSRLYSILGDSVKSNRYMEQAVKISPSNVRLRLIAGIHFLQSGSKEKAARHIKRYLELYPRGYSYVAKLLSGQTTRKIAPLTPKEVIDDFLPEDPKLIYNYAAKYISPNSEEYQTTLNVVDKMLVDISPSDHEAIVLSAKVKEQLGQPAEAIRLFKLALVTRPGDHATQATLIRLLDQMEEYNDAIQRLDELIGSDFQRSEKYRNLRFELKEKLRMKREASR